MGVCVGVCVSSMSLEAAECIRSSGAEVAGNVSPSSPYMGAENQTWELCREYSLEETGEWESSLSLFLYKDLHTSNINTAVTLHLLPSYLPPKRLGWCMQASSSLLSRGLLGFQETPLILRTSLQSEW